MKKPKEGDYILYKDQRYVYTGGVWKVNKPGKGGKKNLIPVDDDLNSVLTTQFDTGKGATEVQGNEGKSLGSDMPSLADMKAKGNQVFSEAAKKKAALENKVLPTTSTAKTTKSGTALVNKDRETGAITPISTAKTSPLNGQKTADDAFVTEEKHEPYWNALAQRNFDRENPSDTTDAKMGGLEGLAGYIPDAFKLGLGLLGASEKLPEYEIPTEFLDYKNRLKGMSNEGFSVDELGNARRDAERGYAYDVAAVRDFSGGRPGVALANLGRASNSLTNAYGNINMADASMRRSNLSAYGGVLGQYLNLDRAQFEDKYGSAMMNKQAGAQLAANSLSNIENRFEFNQSYGEGSTYDLYNKSLLEYQNLLNDRQKYANENPLDLENAGFDVTQIPDNIYNPEYLKLWLEQAFKDK